MGEGRESEGQGQSALPASSGWSGWVPNPDDPRPHLPDPSREIASAARCPGWPGLNWGTASDGGKHICLKVKTIVRL